MKSEYIDKIKELVTSRDNLLNQINELNEKVYHVKEDLKKVEKDLEEQCVVITKEKLQNDKKPTT